MNIIQVGLYLLFSSNFKRNQNIFSWSSKSSTGLKLWFCCVQWISCPLVIKENGWKQQWGSSVYLVYLLGLSTPCVVGKKKNDFEKWGCLITKGSSRGSGKVLRRRMELNHIGVVWPNGNGNSDNNVLPKQVVKGTEKRGLMHLEQSWVVSKWLDGP